MALDRSGGAFLAAGLPAAGDWPSQAGAEVEMNGLPRLALGTIQPEADLQRMLWALLEVFRRAHRASQVYFSRSLFTPIDVAQVVGGRCQRYLDSWLMSPKTCRRTFCLGSQGSDISLVCGRYAGSAGQSHGEGGTLDTLARWLQLPAIVVLDVSRPPVDNGPRLPPQVAGLLLDRAGSDLAGTPWRRWIRSQTKAPVLGALGCPNSSAYRPGGRERLTPGRQEIRQLADDLLQRLHLKELLHLARQTEWPSADQPLLACSACRPGATVAIALDEAFHCYFPDTLDALEMQGARLCDFSPLRAENLPPQTDLVLLGCGHPERYAERLSANICLRQALQSHVRSGGRVYAEGGGLAYICQAICVGSREYPMAGLLPAIARLQPTDPQPIEFRLAHPSWLGRRQALIRGYLNGSWQIETLGPLIDLVDDPEHRLDLVGFRQVIGSRVHLHFSAQPAMLRNLLRPLPCGAC